VYWVQNGRKIDPAQDKNFLVTAEGHLIVVAAKLTDSGNYSCVAENIASTRTSDSATITVYGKTNFNFDNLTSTLFIFLLMLFI
jgi:leucine-rich repeat transmembrane protein FLRT